MPENKHVKVMKECDEQLASVGVNQRGGKKYMMVKDRMTIFRRSYGLEYGIRTELLTLDDTRVVVQAQVIDNAGTIIGSGLAEERRGSTPVNKASALENCESSAIGRALASLGMHGGEYPTLDEMESDKRSRVQINDKVAMELDAWKQRLSAASTVLKLQDIWEDSLLTRSDSNTDWSKSEKELLINAFSDRQRDLKSQVVDSGTSRVSAVVVSDKPNGDANAKPK